MTTRSRSVIRDVLGLNDLPDDELMRLLEDVGEEEIVTGVPPAEAEGWSPEEIRGALEE